MAKGGFWERQRAKGLRRKLSRNERNLDEHLRGIRQEAKARQTTIQNWLTPAWRAESIAHRLQSQLSNLNEIAASKELAGAIAEVEVINELAKLPEACRIINDITALAGDADSLEFARQSGVPACPASDDLDFAEGLELLGRDVHLVEEDAACFLADASESGVANGARLLKNLLEHEVLVAALFRHDGVPEHVLHFAVHGTSVEIAELNTIGGEHGHIAIGVDDVQATCEQIRVCGGKITREPGAVKGGSTMIAFVQDPDGYKIELIERK